MHGISYFDSINCSFQKNMNKYVFIRAYNTVIRPISIGEIVVSNYRLRNL